MATDLASRLRDGQGADRELDEPMAVVEWDFTVWDGKHRLQGSYEMRTLSEAKDLAEIMNDDFGAGSHWVKPLNKSYAEHLALLAATQKE